MATYWAGGSILTRAGNPIAELTNITGPSEKADTIDSSNLASTFRTFIVGLRDAGDLSLEGNLYPGDALGQVAMHADLASGTERAYVLTFPPAMGASMSFQGLVTAFSTGTPMEGKVPFSATIKISGVPTLNITASNNITVLVGIEENIGVALDFVPNFLATTYIYSTALINTASTWVKVTVTFAAGVGTVECLGVTQSLVSTVQSGAILIGAANTSSVVTITIKETNKVATVYTIHVPRP